MNIPTVTATTIGRLVSRLVDTDTVGRRRREWWSYFGSFGDDFFSDQ